MDIVWTLLLVVCFFGTTAPARKKQKRFTIIPNKENQKIIKTKQAIFQSRWKRTPKVKRHVSLQEEAKADLSATFRKRDLDGQRPQMNRRNILKREMVSIPHGTFPKITPNNRYFSPDETKEKREVSRRFGTYKGKNGIPPVRNSETIWKNKREAPSKQEVNIRRAGPSTIKASGSRSQISYGYNVHEMDKREVTSDISLKDRRGYGFVPSAVNIDRKVKRQAPRSFTPRRNINRNINTKLKRQVDGNKLLEQVQIVNFQIKVVHDWRDEMTNSSSPEFELLVGNVVDAFANELTADYNFHSSIVTKLSKADRPHMILVDVAATFYKTEANPLPHLQGIISKGWVSGQKIDPEYFILLGVVNGNKDMGKLKFPQKLKLRLVPAHVETTSTATPPVNVTQKVQKTLRFKEIRISIKLKQLYGMFLSDRKSPEFRELGGNLEQAIYKIFSRDSFFLGTKTLGFRESPEGRCIAVIALDFKLEEKYAIEKMQAMISGGDLAGMPVDDTYLIVNSLSEVRLNGTVNKPGGTAAPKDASKAAPPISPVSKLTVTTSPPETRSNVTATPAAPATPLKNASSSIIEIVKNDTVGKFKPVPELPSSDQPSLVVPKPSNLSIDTTNSSLLPPTFQPTVENTTLISAPSPGLSKSNESKEFEYIASAPGVTVAKILPDNNPEKEDETKPEAGPVKLVMGSKLMNDSLTISNETNVPTEAKEALPVSDQTVKNQTTSGSLTEIPSIVQNASAFIPSVIPAPSSELQSAMEKELISKNLSSLTAVDETNLVNPVAGQAASDVQPSETEAASKLPAQNATTLSGIHVDTIPLQTFLIINNTSPPAEAVAPVVNTSATQPFGSSPNTQVGTTPLNGSIIISPPESPQSPDKVNETIYPLTVPNDFELTSKPLLNASEAESPLQGEGAVLTNNATALPLEEEQTSADVPIIEKVTTPTDNLLSPVALTNGTVSLSNVTVLPVPVVPVVPVQLVSNDTISSPSTINLLNSSMAENQSAQIVPQSPDISLNESADTLTLTQGSNLIPTITTPSIVANITGAVAPVESSTPNRRPTVEDIVNSLQNTSEQSSPEVNDNNTVAVLSKPLSFQELTTSATPNLSSIFIQGNEVQPSTTPLPETTIGGIKVPSQEIIFAIRVYQPWDDQYVNNVSIASIDLSAAIEHSIDDALTARSPYYLDVGVQQFLKDPEKITIAHILVHFLPGEKNAAEMVKDTIKGGKLSGIAVDTDFFFLLSKEDLSSAEASTLQTTLDYVADKKQKPKPLIYKEIRFELKINQLWNESFDNNNSITYAMFSGNVEQAFDRGLMADPNYIDTTVLGMEMDVTNLTLCYAAIRFTIAEDNPEDTVSGLIKNGSLSSIQVDQNFFEVFSLSETLHSKDTEGEKTDSTPAPAPLKVEVNQQNTTESLPSSLGQSEYTIISTTVPPMVTTSMYGNASSISTDIPLSSTLASSGGQAIASVASERIVTATPFSINSRTTITMPPPDVLPDMFSTQITPTESPFSTKMTTQEQSIPVTESTNGIVPNEIEGSLMLQQNWQPYLTDKSSVEYKLLEQTIISEIKNVYAQKNEEVFPQVVSLTEAETPDSLTRNGSDTQIALHFKIMFPPGHDVNLEPLKTAVADNALGDLLIFPTSFSLNGKDGNGLGKCLQLHSIAVSAAEGQIGGFIPECTPEGSFKSVQCHALTGYCWCVNHLGVRIIGTEERYKEPSCDGISLFGDVILPSNAPTPLYPGSCLVIQTKNLNPGSPLIGNMTVMEPDVVNNTMAFVMHIPDIDPGLYMIRGILHLGQCDLSNDLVKPGDYQVEKHYEVAADTTEVEQNLVLYQVYDDNKGVILLGDITIPNDVNRWASTLSCLILKVKRFNPTIKGNIGLDQEVSKHVMRQLMGEGQWLHYAISLGNIRAGRYQIDAIYNLDWCSEDISDGEENIRIGDLYKMNEDFMIPSNTHYPKYDFELVRYDGKTIIKDKTIVHGKIILPNPGDLLPQISCLNIQIKKLMPSGDSWSSPTITSYNMTNLQAVEGMIDYNLELSNADNGSYYITAVLNRGWCYNGYSDEWIKDGDLTSEESDSFVIDDSSLDISIDINMTEYKNELNVLAPPQQALTLNGTSTSPPDITSAVTTTTPSTVANTSTTPDTNTPSTGNQQLEFTLLTNPNYVEEKNDTSDNSSENTQSLFSPPPPEIADNSTDPQFIALPNGLPHSCEGIRDAGLGNVDGQYIIEARTGCHISVICVNMDDKKTKEFLGGPSEAEWKYWHYAVLIKISEADKRNLPKGACLEFSEPGRALLHRIMVAGAKDGNPISKWKTKISNIIRRKRNLPKKVSIVTKPKLIRMRKEQNSKMWTATD